MKTFIHTDPSFDPENTNEYHISIQAGLNGYAFAVLDLQSNRYVAAGSQDFGEHDNTYEMHKKFSKLLNEDEFLAKPYQSVIFAPFDSKSTLIPEVFFDKKELQTYANANFSMEEHELLESDTLDKLKMTHLYTLDSHFSTSLINSFDNVRFYHPGTALVISSMGYPYNKVNITRVFADVLEDRAFVAIANANKLLFFNTFPYKTSRDLVYYLMNAFEQQSLNPDSTPLLVSGFVFEDTELSELLKRFFKGLKYRKLNNRFSYSREFNRFPEHVLVNLFNLYECELSEVN